MINVFVEETTYDRRVAFRKRDFVVVIKERGWDDFHRNTPELRRQKSAQNQNICKCEGKISHVN